MRKIFISLLILGSCGHLSAQDGIWVPPASADTLINPLKSQIGSALKGGILYQKLCAACHGEKGLGDGIAGLYLSPRPADHTSARIKNLSDGAIFWMITEGRGAMPSQKSTLTDDERWQLVMYIRQLGNTHK